jgi:hypothetical protein
MTLKTFVLSVIFLCTIFFHLSCYNYSGDKKSGSGKPDNAVLKLEGWNQEDIDRFSNPSIITEMDFDYNKLTIGDFENSWSLLLNDPYWANIKFGTGIDKRDAARKALAIIKYYKFDKRVYLHTRDFNKCLYVSSCCPPVGPHPGEDVAKFNLNSLEIKQNAMGKWELKDKYNTTLLIFLSQARADSVKKRIEKNKYDVLGYFSRPNAIYFRRSLPYISSHKFDYRQLKVEQENQNEWVIIHATGDPDWRALVFGSTDQDREMAEKALRIIHHYGLDEKFLLDKKNKNTAYFLANRSVPSGPFQGEDKIEISLQHLKVHYINKEWTLYDELNRNVILNFGTYADRAENALKCIKEFGFKYKCFFKKPDYFYFRK